jgi:predicted RNase H-related nuclease YkuK (DUF458 family)
MVREMNWLTPEGLEVDIIAEIIKYTRLEIPIPIGTDSMIRNDKVTFATAIGFHSFEKNVGNYFFSKKTYDRDTFKDLFSRLGKELMVTIDVAKSIRSEFENAKIELHVDISDKPGNGSNVLSEYARAWNGYEEFKIIIKPDAWAASGCADWHTK